MAATARGSALGATPAPASRRAARARRTAGATSAAIQPTHRQTVIHAHPNAVATDT
ncbi:MAG: hypothetical protein HY701_15060 [Gemmatimonadetes bacterium]|nr:hypothetical protein [Gemmatimonadota bacterium]